MEFKGCGGETHSPKFEFIPEFQPLFHIIMNDNQIPTPAVTASNIPTTTSATAAGATSTSHLASNQPETSASPTNPVTTVGTTPTPGGQSAGTSENTTKKKKAGSVDELYRILIEKATKGAMQLAPMGFSNEALAACGLRVGTKRADKVHKETILYLLKRAVSEGFEMADFIADLAEYSGVKLDAPKPAKNSKDKKQP